MIIWAFLTRWKLSLNRTANSLINTLKPEEFSIQILNTLVCMIIWLCRWWSHGWKLCEVFSSAFWANRLNLAHTIMIGDREHDVLGAQAQSYYQCHFMATRKGGRSRRHLYYQRSWQCSFYRITFSKNIKLELSNLLNIAWFNISIGVYLPTELSHTN